MADAWFWWEAGGGQQRTPEFDETEVRLAASADRTTYLGGGAFGETWLVCRGDDERALKIIKAQDYDPDRLEREVDGLRTVTSSNVVRLLDVREVTLRGDDHVGLECEFVPGGDVGGRIARQEWPDDDELHEFAVGLLVGLRDIHAVDLIHRDLKPENVALRDGGWGTPVILDLGLVRLISGGTITSYPTLVGTPAYMAPEQVRGEKAGPGADLWAVGVMLHVLLAHEHPFYDGWDERLNGERAYRRLQDGPCDLPSSAPEALSMLSRRLLSIEPYQRGSVSRALRELA